MRKAEDEGHLLTKEAQRAASYLRYDFEKGGIHLSNGTFYSSHGIVNHFWQKVKVLIFYFRETRESQSAKLGNFSIVPGVSVVLSTTFF